MLDSETKRRIDNARDILVGKVPDPKSQVEQITIALIYKFMDDQDAQSMEMGGKASFFTGEYAKFAWAKIFDPKLGGHEMSALYGEAIEQLNHNPNIPQFFRDIFKNARLPYRDPETLRLFLKQINEFRYDHSERLGDAFEYLLSVLGSQGDAGQFRTPRHIIDFIVQVVDPKKGDTILDPACGTAGFLISAYKHIIESNPGITPDERKRLMENVVGYDISPIWCGCRWRICTFTVSLRQKSSNTTRLRAKTVGMNITMSFSQIRRLCRQRVGSNHTKSFRLTQSGAKSFLLTTLRST